MKKWKVAIPVLAIALLIAWYEFRPERLKPLPPSMDYVEMMTLRRLYDTSECSSTTN